MKIAFVAQPTDVVPPVGGASIAIWVNELSRHLVMRYSVIVYSREGFENHDRVKKNGVTHCKVSVRSDGRIIRWVRRIDQLLRRENLPDRSFFYKRYYFTRLYYLFYVLGVARQARRDKIDVIIVPNYAQFLPFLRFICRRSRLVLVMQCDWLAELPPSRAYRWARHADLILGCSNYVVDGVRNKHPRLSSRCAVLYNASDTSASQSASVHTSHRERLALANGHKVLLFAGRLTPEKGIHVLLEAMDQVLNEEPHCILILLGSVAVNPPSPASLSKKVHDSYEQLKVDWATRLKRQVGRLGGAVRFLGAVQHDQVWDYYRQCDVFVHPALWNEPFGMTLTEAMACERPVVATAVGGIPEIVVNGETGFLVAPGDAVGLAKALLDLLADESLRRRMGQAGRNRVESQFSWEIAADTLGQILDEKQQR